MLSVTFEDKLHTFKVHQILLRGFSSELEEDDGANLVRNSVLCCWYNDTSIENIYTKKYSNLYI